MGKKQTKAKKTELKKSKEDFVPGTENEEQFEKVLFLLSEWIKAGIVDVKIDVDGDIHFDLPSEMEELLKTQVPRDLKHRDVVAIIRNELPALISASLAKNPGRRLRFILPENLNEKIDLMVERGEKTVGMLVSKNLKERILLRKASPSYVIDELRDMAGTYHVESEKNEKVDVPYLSLELTLARPRSEQMLAVNPKERTVRFSRKDDIKVTIDLHKEDLKDLIKKLNKIDEKISE